MPRRERGARSYLHSSFQVGMMEHGETSQSVSKFHHNHCSASCASVASTETWRGELQAITGLTGRQHTQVDSAAFNLMRVFGWGEINTLPSQGRSWEGRGGPMRSYGDATSIIFQNQSNYPPSPGPQCPHSEPSEETSRKWPRETGENNTLCPRQRVSGLRAANSPSACLTHNLGPESR